MTGERALIVRNRNGMVVDLDAPILDFLEEEWEAVGRPVVQWAMLQDLLYGAPPTDDELRARIEWQRRENARA